jgi:large repetitive protein
MVTVVLAAIAVAAGVSRDAAATQQPIEMKFACALKSNGLMRYVSNLNQCKSTEDKVTIHPGPISLCINPDGSVRKIPPFQCKKPGVVLTIPPASGTVYFCAKNSTGVLRYVTDPSQCNSTEFPVFVGPNNQPPVAVADSYSTDEDTPLTVPAPGVLANDSDPDGDPITAVLVGSGPLHAASFALNANGSFSYTPNPDYNGSDSFQYKDNDTHQAGNTVTVSLTINAVNDAPVNHLPAAQSVNQDSSLVLSSGNGNQLSVSDVDAGSDPGFEVQLSVSHGTLTLSTTSGLTVTGNGTASVDLTGTLANANAALNGLTYAPTSGYFGPDSLAITSNDHGATGSGGAKSDSDTLAITVSHVNHAPFATADSYSTDEDTPLNVSAPGVLTNDTDLDGDTLHAVLDSGPSHAAPSGFTLNADGSFSYTPAADYNGSDSFTYHANDGTANSNTVTVTLTINAVNDAPVNHLPAAQSVNQDSSLVLSSGNGNQLSVSDVDAGSDPGFEVQLSVSHGTLTLSTTNNLTVTGNGTAAVDLTGTLADANAALNGLTYTPTSGYFGPDSLAITSNDHGATGSGGAKSDSDTLAITVNHVNHAPLATDDAYSTDENTPLNVSAPGVLTNDTDIDGDTLHAVLDSGPSHADSFALNADGSFSYTPATGYSGSDSFTYHANDGIADSNVATVTLTVNHVNQAPVLANIEGSALSYTEGDPATAITSTLTVSDVDSANLASATVAISAGYQSGADVLAFTNQNGITGSWNAVTGTLTLTGSASLTDYQTALRSVTYANTSDAPTTNTRTVSFQVDDGQAQNHASNTQTRDISVTAVNDAPSLANIEGTALAYDESVDSPPTQSQITTSLTVADPDTNIASATVQITTACQSSEDVLVFTNQLGISGSYNAASCLLTLTGSATPADYQTALRSVKYEDTSDTPNTTTRTVTFQVDDGQAQNHASNTQTRDITVTAENDSPVGATDHSAGVNGNIGISVPAGPDGLLNGVTDPEGDTLTAQVVSAPAGTLTINGSTGSYTYDPPAGRRTNDSATYKVCDNGTPSRCTATKTLTLQISTPLVWFVDNSKVAAGDGTLAHPFNTLAGFNGINDAAAGHPQAGDSVFIDRQTATDYTGPLALLGSQKVIGAGAGASIATISGITPATYANTLPSTGGTRPVVTTASGNAITLGSGNTVRGLNIGNKAGSGIAGTSFGTLTLSEVDITGSGQALNLDTGTANASFGKLSSTSGTNGVRLNAVAGSPSVSDNTSALSGSTGNELEITGGGGSFTYPGSITNSGTNKAVNVTGKTGGTIALSGAVTDNGGTGDGVFLNSNTGATITFSGGLDLSTGATAAFTATGGGTVTATQNNSTIINKLATTSGTALNVANTTIGASGLTFRSINAGTASGTAGDGIILDTTGNSGGLTVTGNSSGACGGTVTGTTPSLSVTNPNSGDCSGGEIRHKTGSDGSTTNGIGIYLNSTGPVSLTRMWLHDFDNFGIYGSGVSGLTISNSLFNGSNGTNQSGTGEGAVYFFGLSGAPSITNSFFSGGAFDSVHVENDGAQVLNRITFTGDNFGDTLNATSASALFMQADCTAQLNATVDTSVFTAARSNNLNVSVRAQSNDDLVVSNSQFSNSDPNQVSGGSNLAIGAGGPSSGCSDNSLNPTLTYNIHNNTFRDALGTALSISKGGVGTGTFGTIANPGIINSNVFGVSGNSTSSGAGAIGSILVGGGSITNNITNNTIHGAINGINIGANSSVAGGGQGYYRATIQGNTVDTPNVGAGNITNGLLAQFGAVSTDNPKACLTLGSSTAALKNNLDGGRNGGADLRLRVRFGTLIGILGYAGANNDDAAMTSFLNSQNTFGTAGAVVTNNALTGSGWTGSCPA